MRGRGERKKGRVWGKHPFETRSHGVLVIPEVTQHTRSAQFYGSFPPTLSSGISGMHYYGISRGDNYVSPLKASSSFKCFTNWSLVLRYHEVERQAPRWSLSSTSLLLSRGLWAETMGTLLLLRAMMLAEFPTIEARSIIFMGEMRQLFLLL